MASSFELAYRAWPVLVDAAESRRLLSYAELASAVGLGSMALAARHALSPIFYYCLEKGLPYLTSIVINQQTNEPGVGFLNEWSGDLNETYEAVFSFDWRQLPVPFPPEHRMRFEARARASVIPANFMVSDQEVLTNGRGPYQTQFRKLLIDAYRGCCAMCETRLRSVLVAAHLVPWSVDRRNRLNPRNGLLLCRLHDALLEAHHVRVLPDLTVTVSLSEAESGAALYDFVQRHTVRELRQPRKGYQPDPAFLQWRLADAKHGSE